MSHPVIVNRQWMARTAATRWWLQFAGSMRSRGGWEMANTFSRLEKLGKNASPLAVDKVMGNSEYTAVPACDGCQKQDLPFVVRFGPEVEVRHWGVHLCVDCLAAGTDLATKIKPGLKGLS